MEDKIFVPPIKIQGIKTKIVPLIKQKVDINPQAVWYEPFVGSGVVGFNLAPEKAVFADTNPCIISFYNTLKAGIINAGIVRDYLEIEGEKLKIGDSDYYYEDRKSVV